MRSPFALGAAAAVLITGTALTFSSTHAMPVAGGMRSTADKMDLIQNAAFVWNGRSYCWYDDGWNGPGWYVCGEYTVRGVGWGGGAGWHGWTHTGGGTAVRG